MIANLVRGAIARRGWVIGLTIVFVIAAAILGIRLKLDALPDITTNQVLVLTGAPGLTPEEVERQVTRPIELALGGLPGLVEHRSISRYGISAVTAVFEDDVDPYRARQMVSERLTSAGADLPDGVGPPELGPLTGGLGEVLHFTLASPSRTPAELLELAALRVAPLLRAVPGVVEVNTWGGEQRTFEVVADPAKLAARGMSFDQLRASVERATGAVAGASVAAGRGQALLRGVARPSSPSDLGHAIAARLPSGEIVRLADVAEIRTGARPRIGAATADGRGEVVYVMVQMLRGDNALDLMDRLHARMPEVRRALPEDVTIAVVYDRSDLVLATLRTVGKSLAEGGVLVVLVLFAMLGSLRAGLVVASVIPLSMLGALLGMVALDVPGNLMSLGAIDFGLVVDGAVVMVEHLFRVGNHCRAGPRDDGTFQAADERRRWMSDATAEVASPVFFSVLIILLVYVPVLSLTGVDGKMFRPMAITVVLALVFALVLSLTYIPAVASLVLRPEHVPARDPLLVRLIDRAYAPMLGLAVRRPRAVAALAAAMLVAGGAVLARSGSELVPQLDEGDLVVQTTRAPDISIEGAIQEAGRLETAVRAAVPEVTQIVSRSGSPAVATDIMGIEQADVFIALLPREQWRPGLTREALIEQIQRAIDAGAPGSDPSFTQPIQMRFNELLGGSVADVTVSVYGSDLTALRAIASQIAAALEGLPGAADVKIFAPPDVSLVEVRPRALEAAQAGFAVGEILDVVQALRGGIDAGITYDGPVRIPIVLRLGSAASAFDLERVPLAAPSGGMVPLGRVATIETVGSPGLVNHHEGERRLIVGFNVRGADLGALVEAGQRAIEANVKVPPDTRVVWGGQFEAFRAATRRLALVIPAVVVLILGALYAAFRKVRPTLIIFTNVPFACVGGAFALALRGSPISMSAAVGFIALSGVAVLNGVVLLSRVLILEAEGRSPAEAAEAAARSRARPVLMTALVAALGFVPMMLATGVGSEVQRPLATVVVGGLVTSTLLTLLVLPSLYPWLSFRIHRSRPAATQATHHDAH